MDSANQITAADVLTRTVEWLRQVMPAGYLVSASGGRAVLSTGSTDGYLEVGFLDIVDDQQPNGPARALTLGVHRVLDHAQDLVVETSRTWWPSRSPGEAESLPRVEMVREGTMRLGYADSGGWITYIDLAVGDRPPDA